MILSWLFAAALHPIEMQSKALAQNADTQKLADLYLGKPLAATIQSHSAYSHPAVSYVTGLTFFATGTPLRQGFCIRAKYQIRFGIEKDRPGEIEDFQSRFDIRAASDNGNCKTASQWVAVSANVSLDEAVSSITLLNNMREDMHSSFSPQVVCEQPSCLRFSAKENLRNDRITDIFRRDSRLLVRVASDDNKSANSFSGWELDMTDAFGTEPHITLRKIELVFH